MFIGSLFSGVGGLELGLEWAGVGRTAWQVEADAFRRSVLARWWPGAVRFDDVRAVGAKNLTRVDVVCGGFPCQDLSWAGKGAGIDGERSGLWSEFARVLGELRPRFAVVENVAAIRSRDRGRALGRVLGDLAALGYDAEWHSVRASDVGAPHKRERVFVLAYADKDRRKGVRRSGVLDGEREALRDYAHRCGSPGHLGDSDALGRIRWTWGEPEARGRREPSFTGSRAPESGLGGGAHGLPARVDRWPASPGAAQAEWEPSRVTQALDWDRASRLRALGDAVVPQVGRVVGRRLLEIVLENAA